MTDNTKNNRDWITARAPVGVRYHLPRAIAVQGNSAHYGHGFWPLQPGDLVNISEEMRQWLIERDKSVPVILYGMPSTKSVLEALHTEKARLDDARESLQRRMEAEIQEVLEGGPEGFWELGRARGTEYSPHYCGIDVSVNYTRFFVRELLRVKDDDEVELDATEMNYLVRAHITNSQEIRQAMIDADAYRQELEEEAIRLTEENRLRAVEKVAKLVQEAEDREKTIAELLEFVALTDERVRKGLEAGYSMEEDLDQTTLDAICGEFNTTEGAFGSTIEAVVESEDCESLGKASSPSWEAMTILDELSTYQFSEMPKAIRMQFGDIVLATITTRETPKKVWEELPRAFVQPPDELIQTEREAIEVMVSVPGVYDDERKLLILIGPDRRDR